MRKVETPFFSFLSDEKKKQPHCFFSPFSALHSRTKKNRLLYPGVIKTERILSSSYHCSICSEYDCGNSLEHCAEIEQNACRLRASLSQRDLNCAAQAFPLHLHLGLFVGAEVPAALPLTQPV